MRYLLLTFSLLLLSPGGVHALMEHQFLYFPDHTLRATPADAGLVYEEVFFPAADGTRLHGWYLPGREDLPLVLICHGNAGNIGDRVEMLRFLHGLGASSFIFDYRGYGKSRGRADEEGTYADARGALAWLGQRGWAPERLIYHGRSLGASVALQLALEAPPAGVVLETPFTSLADMGRHHYPLLYRLLGWLLHAEYDNAGKIGRLSSPLLVIQGGADWIAPPEMGQRLYGLAPEPKRLLLLPNMGHNDLFHLGGEDYEKAWREILNDADKRR